MDDIEVRTETAEATGPETILSPGMANDVSVIGVFLGLGLALTLFINNLRRGYASIAVLGASFKAIVAAAMGVRTAAAVVKESSEEPMPGQPGTDVVVTSTSTTAVTYVFSPEGPSSKVGA